MSIASEISRLSSNISDSLDAVAAKGVTVPSDSNSDDLPGLIALIEQSSGGDSGGTIYQDTDGYLHLSEDDKNVISIVDTLDTAGGTIRTITSKVDSGGYTLADIVEGTAPSGVVDITGIQFGVNGLYMYSLAYRPNITRVIGTASLGTSSHLMSYTLSNCIGLTSANLHLTVSYVTALFQGCVNLNTVVLVIDGTNNAINTFSGCSSLEIVDLNANKIGPTTFYNNSSLQTIILRSESITTLGNINAFNGSTFASGGSGGTIYIPEVLYDHLGDGGSYDYKVATNWSTIDGYGTITWAQIEGSIYETQYADGTPIT